MSPEIAPVRGKGDLDKTTPDEASERWRRTAVAAFYRAQARGFAPGGELDDWLAAEREVIHAVDQSAALPAVAEPTTPSKAAPRRRPAKGGSRGRKAAPGSRTDSGGGA